MSGPKTLLLGGAAIGALWLLSRSSPAPIVPSGSVSAAPAQTICKSTRITRADGTQGPIPWPVGTVVTLPDMTRATVVNC